MFNENLEIFFPEYTKKIKLLAKIETTENDASITKYLLQTHGTTYVLQHSFTEGFYYYRDPENILEIYDIDDIFKVTDEIRKGKHQDFLKGKSVVLFFPNTSIRTRDI